MTQLEIIVGSQMGSAEYVADQLKEALENQGFVANLHEQPDLAHCEHDHWLIVTSTYGAGDYPENLLSFIDQVNQQGSMSSKQFAVVGLGDTSYDTYNHAAKNIAQLLVDKGATNMLPVLEINVLDEALPEDTALSWLPLFSNALMVSQ
ncbi:flavodoxin domain-containing protein [Pseudoalteromonas citrea]|nr:flavodoxin domain-containing protein [Pseudoalteromonas citrea]